MTAAARRWPGRPALLRALPHMLWLMVMACSSRHHCTACRMAVHMDCLHWVNRDSYLPQGSRGLKVGLRPAACGCC